MTVTVVNRSVPAITPRDAIRVYIGRGRGSVLGNDWTHLDHGLASHRVATREAAIEAWTAWVRTQRNDSPVGKELARLRAIAAVQDLELECFCAPLACHGDIIKKLIESHGT